MQVFVSYRRSDAPAHAGRLTDGLARHFGARSVFHDVTTIAPGEDFTLAIDRALADCDAVLVVIGPGWLTATSPQGGRRLLDPGDHVRLEVATALRRDSRVVPVLVGGAALPAATDLPDDLRGLPQRQTVVLHDTTWNQDVDGLVVALRDQPSAITRRPRWVLAAAAALVALVVVGALTWWPAGSGGDAEIPEPLRCEQPQGQGWTPIALGASPSTAAPHPGGPLIFTVTDGRWRADGERWLVVLAVTMDNATGDTVSQGSWLYPSLVVARRPWPPNCFSATSGTVDRGQVADVLVGFSVGCAPVGPIALEVENGRVDLTGESAGSNATTDCAPS